MPKEVNTSRKKELKLRGLRNREFTEYKALKCSKMCWIDAISEVMTASRRDRVRLSQNSVVGWSRLYVDY